MNDRPLKIVAISGSLRHGSFNTALLRVAASVAPDDMTVDIVPIDDLPMYNRDDEVRLGFTGPVARLRTQVAEADGLLLASPEYNYSVTGALKNALDWLSRYPAPVDRMPVAIRSGAGRLGGVRSLAHLRDILRHNDMILVGRPEVLVTGVGTKFDAEGNFTDERATEQIARMMHALRRTILDARTTAARILVVGRHDQVMRPVLAALKSDGYRPSGVLTDDDAIEMLKTRRFEAMLVGGGVEPDSRERLAALAADAGVAVGHNDGSQSLEELVVATLSGQ